MQAACFHAAQDSTVRHSTTVRRLRRYNHPCSWLLKARLWVCRCPCAVFNASAGRIGKIRLLGDLQHSTRISFIEFIDAEAAMAALNCSGALLGRWLLLLLMLCACGDSY